MLEALVSQAQAEGRPIDAAAIAAAAGCSQCYAFTRLRAMMRPVSVAPDGAPLRFVPLAALA